MVFVIFFFQADNGWSGSSLYNQWVYSGYNFFVGLLPFYMGFFGYDTTKETVNKYPALYAAGLRGMDLNIPNMVWAVVEAIGAGVLC